MVGSSSLRKYAWSRVSRIGALFGLTAMIGALGLTCPIPNPCDLDDAPVCDEGQECFNIDNVAECRVACGADDDPEDICDDGNACTDDACTDGGWCNSTAVECETDGDVCDPSTGECAPACVEDGCDDENLCTDDACNADSGLCENTATECPDGETCDPADGGCVADLCVDVECDDDNLCTDDSCDPLTGECGSTNNTAECDDEDACTDNDACADGVCAGTELECPEGEVCVDAECVVDLCADVDCDDADACTDDTCDPLTGECSSTNNTAECDDGDACTENDVCADGACAGSAVECPEGESCNAETGECGPIEACDDDNPCVDDGLFCNGIDECVDALCVSGPDPCADTDCGEDTPICDEGDDSAICSCPPVPQVLFTLDSDNLTGTPGDDTFSAPLKFVESSGNQIGTLQTGDRAEGLGGADVLNASWNQTGNPTIVPTSLTGIETFNLTAFDETTLNMKNVSQVTTVNTVDSADVMNVTNLQQVVNAGMTSTDQNFVLAFVTSVTSGSDDEMTWNIDDVTGGNPTINGAANGFETLTFNSTGSSANIVGTLTQGSGTSLKTLKFTGDQKLTLKASGANTVKVIDATGSSGGVTLGQGVRVGGTDPYTTFNTVAIDTITGGSGDDMFIFAGTFDGNDASEDTETIDGGDGTDVVQLSLTGSLGTALPFRNIEELRINTSSAATLLFTSVTGLKTLRIEEDGGSSLLTLTNVAGLPALDFRGDGVAGSQTFDSVTYTATGVQGSSDTLDITIGNRGKDVEGSSSLTVGGTVTANGFDVINITASDGDTTFNGVTGTTLGTVTLTANKKLTMGTVTGTAKALLTVDATGVSDDLNVTFDFCGDGCVITSGPGDDTIDTTGSTGTGTTITGGKGNDTLTGAAGADVISGGDGNDTLVGAAGDDNLTAGSGTDSLQGDAGDDTIGCGSGVDTIILNYSSAGADVDTVTSFTKGASGDQFDVDLSALETAGTSGVNANASDFANMDDGASVADGDTILIQELTADAAATANANIFVIVGTTAADTGALETLLETGDREITGSPAGIDQYDVFLVVYSDGTDAFLAAAVVTTDSGGEIVAGNLTVVNLAKISGVTSIAASDFNAANFDFIP